MSKKKNKPNRPKARRPRGFEDKPSDLLRAERRLIEAAFSVYDKHGFEPLQTPAFEYADVLGKFLPDEDRPNTGVFALRDDDEQWMSLRYDLTAPLARFVAENYDALAKPYRRYQAGSVFRNEKPGPGRFREFVQCDADSVGAPGAAADAEMILLAADVMAATGLKPGQYQVRVNNRKQIRRRAVYSACRSFGPLISWTGWAGRVLKLCLVKAGKTTAVITRKVPCWPRKP